VISTIEEKGEECLQNNTEWEKFWHRISLECSFSHALLCMGEGSAYDKQKNTNAIESSASFCYLVRF